MTILIR